MGAFRIADQVSLPTQKQMMAALDAAFAEYVGLAFRTTADNMVTREIDAAKDFRVRLLNARHTYAAAESVISEIGE